MRRHDHVTRCVPFPISVAWRERGRTREAVRQDVLRARLLASTASDVGRFLGVGVDRVDYTKGILERFRGWNGFSRRGRISRAFHVRPDRRAEPHPHHPLRICSTRSWPRRSASTDSFSTANWKPIVLVDRHHGHEEITRDYQAADVCLVTSLHDGMNLVAKEFVAARDDEQGVLVLSHSPVRRTSSRDAIIVNPYDTDQLADAIRRALEMDPTSDGADAAHAVASASTTSTAGPARSSATWRTSQLEPPRLQARGQAHAEGR